MSTSDGILWIAVIILGITIIGEMRRDNKWKIRIEADLLLIRRQQETQIEISSLERNKSDITHIDAKNVELKIESPLKIEK